MCPVSDTDAQYLGRACNNNCRINKLIPHHFSKIFHFVMGCITVCYNKQWIKVFNCTQSRSVCKIKIIWMYLIFNKKAKYLGTACNN